MIENQAAAQASQTKAQSERDELISQLIEVNAGRAAYYRMLAELFFRELTQQQVDHLAGMDFAGMAGDNALIAEGYEDMYRYLRHANSGTRQALACDYAHTFLAAGNYETFAATPFESVFTSELGLMMQEARDGVYKMYCEQHIQPQADLHVPEDHASFEFEFLATVIERTNAALLASDFDRARDLAQTVSDFHAQHQLNWVDDLCDAVLDVAETRFYRGVSKVTRGFVHIETDVIADELDMLQELAGEKAA
ncbi:molecular chaperone [uncultured Senegalimassilia sp.]|uniref:TorD/DmsD family molecular chaperone n=1 Tax=uncultured Senegalimassilia sp. TaxID=1714350 RepID=UPI0026713296|nr:molecular chaperone TorD family protein [uncultured Senegalimassilia sp.]